MLYLPESMCVCMYVGIHVCAFLWAFPDSFGILGVGFARTVVYGVF